MRQSGRLFAGVLSVGLVLVGIMPSGAKDKEWESRFDAGKAADAGGNYGEAQADLEEALKLTARFQTSDPRLAQTYYEVGQLHLNQEDWPTAKDYFERALKVQEKLGDPESVDIGNTLSGLASAQEQLGDHQMAVLLLKRVRNIWIKHYGASDSRLTAILPAMATYAMLDSDYATAQDCYRQLVNIQERTNGANSVGYGVALNSLASCLAYIGKYADAEPIAQKAVAVLSSASDSPSALDSASGILQYIEQQLGKPTSAIAAAPLVNTNVVAQAPAQVKPLSSSLKVTGQLVTPKKEVQAPAQAKTTVDSGIKPWAQADAQNGSANKQQETNQNSGKIQYLAGGKLISPEQFKAMTLANNAYELIREEKYAMAIDILKNALAIYPDLVSAHTNLGLAYSQLGQYDDAVAQLRQAIAIDANRPAAWLNLASTFQLSGKLKESDATYGEFIQRFPNQKLVGKVQGVKTLLDKELKEQEEVAQALGAQGARANDYFTYASHDGTMRWPADKETIKVYIASGADTPGYKDEYAGFLADGFKQWEQACAGKVKFQFVKSPGASDIECTWTDDASKVSTSLEGGEARVEHGGTTISHAAITILTKGPSADSMLSADQLRAVCLHEIGHALGLAGHSPNPQDVMFCSVPAASVKVPLSVRDTATIQKLYASGQTVSWVSW